MIEFSLYASSESSIFSFIIIAFCYAVYMVYMMMMIVVDGSFYSLGHLWFISLSKYDLLWNKFKKNEGNNKKNTNTHTKENALCQMPCNTLRFHSKDERKCNEWITDLEVEASEFWYNQVICNHITSSISIGMKNVKKKKKKKWHKWHKWWQWMISMALDGGGGGKDVPMYQCPFSIISTVRQDIHYLTLSMDDIVWSGYVLLQLPNSKN